jgi:hypothetical protein
VVRCGLASPALLGFTGSTGTYKPIDCIIFSMLLLDRVIVRVFLRGVFSVSLSEFELGLALGAADEITHFPQGLAVQQLVFLSTNDSSDLLRIDISLT